MDDAASYDTAPGALLLDGLAGADADPDVRVSRA